MFGNFFGKYLEDKGVITKEQFEEIMLEQKNSRVKLGLLAVEFGLMTQLQADEVNFIQASKDKRFGDIAIEKGYLTKQQVNELLKKQGNSYLLFVQSITERNILTLDQIKRYIEKYKIENNFNDDDIEALKSGDIDNISTVFVKQDGVKAQVEELARLFIRNVVRFVNESIRLENMEQVSEYDVKYFVNQDMEGENIYFTGVGGSNNSMLDVASSYAKEEFTEVDDDSLDAVGEFLNCNNGLFAAKLSQEDCEVDMMPPVYYSRPIVIKGKLYKLPIYIDGKQIDFIVGLDGNCEVRNKVEKSASVLIVDDSRTSRRILKNILESKNYNIVGEAVNGEDAYEKYKELRPDIVTLDITMPILDGIGALEKIKTEFPDAKIVMVTAAGQKSKMVEAVKLGASDFVTKPFEPAKLLNVVEKVLS